MREFVLHGNAFFFYNRIDLTNTNWTFLKKKHFILLLLFRIFEFLYDGVISPTFLRVEKSEKTILSLFKECRSKIPIIAFRNIIGRADQNRFTPLIFLSQSVLSRFSDELSRFTLFCYYCSGFLNFYMKVSFLRRF